ncbi:cytosolic sulfotransferase 5-like [Lolium rigidum]|uniref:cytosolic sulfotransferase 5-like n=1 Tax=Lolium rigidum TaxID=89674 RepID=UPI001F5DFCB5|nr:cytosolic sulfotransferase 5-like [Lolium rigidum]XP_047050643.1 cytosolic sulfotransferase 5-like [Lolium rigidum]
MASNSPAPVGPVPFLDTEKDDHQVGSDVPPFPLPDDHEHEVVVVSELPSKLLAGIPQISLRRYQGFWLPESWVPAAVSIQRRFKPRPDDVIISSLPKCGTTWLVALAFATMARHAYPPSGADHPLLRLNPHQCIPFLEGVFLGGRGREERLEALPSPRLVNTHMPHAMIACCSRVVYICREPKDMVVSMWHYLRTVHPQLSLQDTLDSVCGGASRCGPFWDHALGYWRASVATPDRVLFLRYEELLRDPAGNVRRLAQFVGQPFSPAEEEAGVLGDVVRLCSLDNLRSLEVNKTGIVGPLLKTPRKALFRKGVVGDWVNHMTPEMARLMDDVVAHKLRDTGLHFK